MLFHTTVFAIFIPLVIIFALVVPRIFLLPTLIISSYIFYGWGAGFFVLLLAGTSTIDYLLALYFNDKHEKRRYGIIISAIINFGVLAYFKYANFAIANLDSILTIFGSYTKSHSLNIILPIGISFFVFQSFAYVVDVLTKKIEPCRSISQYLLFVSWFPQLIAGPISRANMLIPQFEKINKLRDTLPNRLPHAIILFADGWLRKAFADLAAISVNHFYAQDPNISSGASAWYAVIAFGIQIYGDFSGYTRMAQGISWLFGIKLMENFNIPYAADSIRDFWRRWHISLSLWFRDYVYIPLGGNKLGTKRMYVNLALTMMLCGLWHGANWTFVLWGGIHGSLLIIERIGGIMNIKLPRILRHFLVLIFVFLAWVPFRADNIEVTFLTYLALFNPGWHLPTISLVIAILGITACDILQKNNYSLFFNSNNFENLKPSIWLSICIFVWMLCELIGRQQGAEFIYFQF